jgi:hypothetical protein
MTVSTDILQIQLIRQLHHWMQAAKRLSHFENLASPFAWHGIGQELGTVLKNSLKKSIDELLAKGPSLIYSIENNYSGGKSDYFYGEVQKFREKYLKTETTIYFYTDALNTRTSASVSALLRACDILCVKSMAALLQPLGKKTPFVMTYVDKGLGASILKAGLRLWDGSESPIAAIKVTHHNLFRPTAIIHETGHQVAHIQNWNDELSDSYKKGLIKFPKVVSEVFASWASEIAADAFAFVHTGYAAVSALYEVVSGSPNLVFGFIPGDPHPISYLRVLLGFEMCKSFYGKGPWNNLEIVFKEIYNIDKNKFPSVDLIRKCIPALPFVSDITLKNKFRAFMGKSISEIVNPENVSPSSLEKLEKSAGPAIYTSHGWIWNESLRLLALNGLKIATAAENIDKEYSRQESWMIKLGYSINLN